VVAVCGIRWFIADMRTREYNSDPHSRSSATAELSGWEHPVKPEQELELNKVPTRGESSRYHGSPMRKLLIIAYAFPPFPAPGSARAWRLYKYLPEFGYETHVITASLPDKPMPRVTYVPPPTRSLTEMVLRKYVFPADEDVLWAPRAIRAAEQLIMNTQFDAVLSTFPYINVHGVAYRLKKRFGLPWIADYRDPLVGNPFRATRGLPGFVDRFLDRRFFKTADLLVAVTDCGKDSWVQRNPKVATKTAVIWNGFDPEEPIAPKLIAAGSYRVVAHIGNFYEGRSPVMPLASVLRLIRRGTLDPARFRFRFIGRLDPAIWAAHEEVFRQLTNLGCLQWLATVPRADALAAMTESDALMLADNNASGIGYTVPAKLFEYIRVGRPILALTVNDSPVQRILAMSGVPFVTLSPDLDEQTVDQRMTEFLDLSSNPVGVSEDFLSQFNGRNQAQTLASLIDNVLTR
jgi:glycosyltransferase involved in cell wall biosynthesis